MMLYIHICADVMHVLMSICVCVCGTVWYYAGTGKTHTLLGALKYIAVRFAGLEVDLTYVTYPTIQLTLSFS